MTKIIESKVRLLVAEPYKPQLYKRFQIKQEEIQTFFINFDADNHALESERLGLIKRVKLFFDLWSDTLGNRTTLNDHESFFHVFNLF